MTDKPHSHYVAGEPEPVGKLPPRRVYSKDEVGEILAKLLREEAACPACQERKARERAEEKKP